MQFDSYTYGEHWKLIEAHHSFDPNSKLEEECIITNVDCYHPKCIDRS